MDIVGILENYFQQSPLAFMRAIPAELLQFDDRAKYMCKFGCKNYNMRHSCPPESLEMRDEIDRQNNRWALVFATSHQLTGRDSRYQTRALNQQKELEMQRICNEIEAIFDSNGINRIVLSSGPCRQCRECSMKYGEVCRKPKSRRTSMEAVGIDCQKTMNIAGFDFEMPNNGSINRCACILTNDANLSQLYFNNRKSLQKFRYPSREQALEMCYRLCDEYTYLYDCVRLIPLADIPVGSHICDTCSGYGKNFACPPYSGKIDISLWDFAVLWKWNANSKKKHRYNLALKTVHAAFFSLGYYFAMSLRDCYCDECKECAYISSEERVCSARKLLSSSMQSQSIDPTDLGEGKYGLELT